MHNIDNIILVWV